MNCIQCQEETSNPKFCSRSCAAKYNNQKYPKRKGEKTCSECGNPCTRRRSKCYDCQPKRYRSSPSRESNSATRALEEPAVHPARGGKQCNNCKRAFIPKMKTQVYCSHTCQRQFNDRKRKRLCEFENCEVTISHVSESGLCMVHAAHQRYIAKVESWLSGEWDGAQPCGDLSKTIHRYVMEEANYSCSICGFNERHPADNAPIVEVNHIDGNGMNHAPENLEVLCPNHHALTLTYRGRNVGKGRPVFYRRERRTI